MMKIDDIKRIEKELKEVHHLINPSRKINPANNYYCNFGSQDLIFKKEIIFDPKVLDFLEEDGALFSLLHEEGHFVNPQKHKWRIVIKIFIPIIITLLFSPFVSVILFEYSQTGIILTFIVLFVIVFVILHYIDLRFFYQAYWDDEFNADDFAIKGLMQIGIPWQAMRSSFDSLDECKKNKNRGLRSQITYSFNKGLNLTKHPDDESRFKRAEELFNILKNSSQSNNRRNQK